MQGKKKYTSKIFYQLSLDLRLFLGYDLDEELPWRCTLSRKRQLFREQLFLELFRKVLSCVWRRLWFTVKGNGFNSFHLSSPEIPETFTGKNKNLL
ncbi:hypothetical protein OK344_03390 [Kaistella sp. BT6-1-3]|uniref:Transposase InsH N-terminal domain-containing protein n=1 Tax=Kaistella yananensis TaxID=2989820 RepID=A0ABT3JKD0_9FLAO|nr:hypothetical protein [Kaistella yananensis]MCW4451245.1 hypothetical protein [Kaistella yananensis]